MSIEEIAMLISLFLTNLLVSWLGSLLFTDDSETSWAMSTKKWKTFTSIFIGYCIIFFIIYLTQKI